MFGKHPQGTEVKAITYSAMRIRTPAGCYTADDAADAAGAAAAAISARSHGRDPASSGASMPRTEMGEPPAVKADYEIHVIVDI